MKLFHVVLVILILNYLNFNTLLLRYSIDSIDAFTFKGYGLKLYFFSFLFIVFNYFVLKKSIISPIASIASLLMQTLKRSRKNASCCISNDYKFFNCSCFKQCTSIVSNYFNVWCRRRRHTVFKRFYEIIINKHCFFIPFFRARTFSQNGKIRDRYYEGNGKKKDFSVFSKASFNLGEKTEFQ